VEEEHTQRKLAAILAADVVGYSRLMETDEAGTLARLKILQDQLLNPATAQFGGRVFKTTGDGALAEFPSVVDAVQCAIAIQRGVSAENTEQSAQPPLKLRIGISLGDVIIEGQDLYGNGVNIAARLETMADPGGICIAGNVYEQVRSLPDVHFKNLGDQHVKNIRHPVKAYKILIDGQPVTQTSRLLALTPSRRSMAAATVLSLTGLMIAWWEPWFQRIEKASVHRMAHALPAKPSIAVLPFTNMSQDKEQEFFADGITEDIITDLSKISGIFVVARNSSFTYKGKPVRIRQVAEELGVRYVLEGSVRRADEKLRITTQLSDVINGKHLWSNRFDRDVKDVFAVQSEVASQVVKAMAVTLKANELDRLYQKYAANIKAYDAFVRARRMVDPPGKESLAIAQDLFRRAIDLDPGFAGGYAGLAFSFSSKSRLRIGASPEEDARKSLEYAEKAIRVDPNFAWSYIALAGAHLANDDPDAAVDAARQAVQLQPNGYEENLFLGFYLNFAGQSSEAVERLEFAHRISPVESVRGLAFLANAYFMNGQYAESEALRKRRIENFPVRNPNPYIWMAATQSLRGKKEAAAETARQLIRFRPNFRMSKWRFFDSFKLAENRKRLYEAAIRAGIPE
jgi:adenylate cyclase